MKFYSTILRIAAMAAAVTYMAFATQVHAAAVVLFTAGVDISGTSNPVSIPAQGNPHIPSINPGVTLTTPTLLDGVATGPLNGITYGPAAYSGSTGGTTGFVNVSYTLLSGDLTSLFVEVANVGNSDYQSGLALDNIQINDVLVERFESGIPSGWITNGFLTTSGAVTNLAPTEGSSFLFMDTTGGSTPIFDTVDGINGSNLLASLGLSAGDKLSFDIAFMTTDGTDFYHDYGLASLGVPEVVGVPEPGMFALFSLGLIGLGFARRRKAA
jgi:hypothetical protein